MQSSHLSAMNFVLISEIALILLGFWTAVRMLRLRLHRTFNFFAAFIMFEIAQSAIFVAYALSSSTVGDYRVFWVVLIVPEWVLTLCTVYSLLDALLHELPGILSFSHRVLQGAFLLSLAAATAIVFSVGRVGKTAPESPAFNWLTTAMLIDRVVEVVVVLVLLGVSAFVLWFPIRMSRNLFAFIAGLTVYFGMNACAAVVPALGSPSLELVVNRLTFIALSACYIYWSFMITASGEGAMIRVGHGWSSQHKRDRAIRELERMNTALLRSVKG